MTDQLLIEFILPSKDSLILDLTGYDNFFMKDIKHKLYMKEIGIHPSRMNFIYQRKVMKDLQKVKEFNLQPNDKIEILLKVINVQPLFFTYDEFIQSVTPSFKDSSNISIHSQFEILFHKNLSNHMLDLNSLISRDCLKSIYLPSDEKSQQLVREQYHRLHPEKQLFLKSSIPPKHWTDYKPDTNILLLEVDETLELRIERILYNLPDVIEGKLDADFDSWQRYTNDLPIDCRFILDSKYTEFPLQVVLKPYKPLKYSTRYAIFLKCGVATIPISTSLRTTFDFLSDGIGWDKLIFFRTEKEPIPPKVQVKKPVVQDEVTDEDVDEENDIDGDDNEDENVSEGKENQVANQDSEPIDEDQEQLADTVADIAREEKRNENDGEDER